jgi:diguanylate cyclase (GGDEF)-like protein/PAS domain S-box-containing protein
MASGRSATFVTLPALPTDPTIALATPNQPMAKDPARVPNLAPGTALPSEMRRIEGREWWLWVFAVGVTLLLTAGIISFTFPWFPFQPYNTYWADLRDWVRALAALVLMFDLYTIYQHRQLQRTRWQLAEREHLFRLISENAADMIALVDNAGRRLYNSPAYTKVLGYSPDELQTTSSLEQIHPDDRQRVLEAAEKARSTGRGQQLEYRMRHRDGTWRILESTASAIRNPKGEIEQLVIVNRDITERKRAEDMLAHNAFYDGLTNLPNRALFLSRLQHALDMAKRHVHYKFAVLFIDLDEFKVVNDSLGHGAGDELLTQIGQRLSKSLRREDMVARSNAGQTSGTGDESLARIGGDEFTIVLDDIADPSDAVRVAGRIQSGLAVPFLINRQEVVVSASIGIALSTTPRSAAEEVLRDAEIAMYRAKRAGKARCEVFDTAMYATAVQRLRLETDLRKGLERGELINHYQPIVWLRGGAIAGFEALARWRRPQGLVSPGEFLPVACETGLINAINKVLLSQACEQLRTWQAQFPAEPPLVMSVNISPPEFGRPELGAAIRSTLQQSGVPPSSLQLEVMETIAMGDAEAADVLAKFKALGVRLSIDDFGTGYSSLSRLQRLPVDSLKIDRSFISGMDRDREAREIVRIIIMLAHNLELKVVAEGVETEEQARQLRELGCELAQGYFFARPGDAETITQMLRQRLPGNLEAAVSAAAGN